VTATLASGGSGATAALQQLADPDSDLNRQWDEEHDRYVLHCLLDLVEEEFEPITLQAFRRRSPPQGFMPPQRILGRGA
jgi:hypothetical protein